METFGCFINGKHELNNSNNILSIKNPFDEKIKYKVEESNFRQIESALKIGYETFKSGIWRHLSF